MREPQSVTHPGNPEMTKRSMFSGLPELSETGWFNEGLRHFLQESHCRKRPLLTGIHKETPMF